MRKTAMLLCVCAMSAGLLLWTCTKKGPTGPGDGGIGPTSVTYNYTSTETTITISVPAQTYSYNYCIGDSLANYTYSFPGQNMTLPYYISGDTLRLIEGNDTIALIRSGSGSGLIGMWVAADTEQNGPTQLDFNATTITATTYDCFYADDFIENWNCCGTYADSAYYAVTVEKLSCSQVRLTGNTTGEVVTITWNASSDMTYSSSNAGHAAGTVYDNPAWCPNDEPDWYYAEFLGMNYKNLAPAAKRAKKPAVPRVKKHPLFG